MTREQARQVIDIALADMRAEALREALRMVEDYGNAMLGDAAALAAGHDEEKEEEWREVNAKAAAAQELVNKLDALITGA